MILQYSEILQYHIVFKQQFMDLWQQRFYSPWLASAVTKHTAQWRNTTTDMTAEIMTEMKMETTTEMTQPDQDPMVWSSIRSRRLGLVEEDRVSMAMAMRPQSTMYIHFRLYIYPINNIVKMSNKILYVKIGVLNLCFWNMKNEITSWINKKIDYIFEIYNGSPLIACT